MNALCGSVHMEKILKSPGNAWYSTDWGWLCVHSADAQAPESRFGVPSDLTIQEYAMNKDQVEGQAKQVKGKIKEVAGIVTDDKSLEIKGKAKNAEGKLQEAYGNVKNKVKKTLDAVS